MSWCTCSNGWLASLTCKFLSLLVGQKGKEKPEQYTRFLAGNFNLQQVFYTVGQNLFICHHVSDLESWERTLVTQPSEESWATGKVAHTMAPSALQYVCSVWSPESCVAQQFFLLSLITFFVLSLLVCRDGISLWSMLRTGLESTSLGLWSGPLCSACLFLSHCCRCCYHSDCPGNLSTKF